MGGAVRRIIRNPVKAVKDVVGMTGAAPTTSGQSQAAPPAETQKAATKPKEVVKATPKTGAVEGQAVDARSKATQRRGRRSNIMTGSRGVSGNVQTTKKTLLGG